ncbi:MAG: hypothetical protein RQ723_08260 [Desulfuromonadales bacterium]|nr:hypothetical protein [Desulfuromonadales bacterium]
MSRILLLLVAVCLLMAGCETVRGMGKDLENTSSWMHEKANE